ncbi:hypothetical protein HAX54_041208, partial [Datura stramonium]|nr:hypothetical protein [Datura stramonium]
MNLRGFCLAKLGVKKTERHPPANCQSDRRNIGKNVGLGARLEATAQNPCFTCASWVDTGEMLVWCQKRAISPSVLPRTGDSW